MSLARYLSKLGALLGSDGKVPAAALANGAARANFGSGAVLQVVNTYDTGYGNNSTTSTSYVSTGIGVTITPTSATSKILLLFHVGMTYTASASNGVILAIARGSTVLNAGTSNYGGTFLQMQTVSSYAPATQAYLDSPSTTSPVTYNLYGRSQSGSTVYLTHTGSSVSLTAIEVAA